MFYINTIITAQPSFKKYIFNNFIFADYYYKFYTATTNYRAKNGFNFNRKKVRGKYGKYTNIASRKNITKDIIIKNANNAKNNQLTGGKGIKDAERNDKKRNNINR